MVNPLESPATLIKLELWNVTSHTKIHTMIRNGYEETQTSMQVFAEKSNPKFAVAIALRLFLAVSTIPNEKRRRELARAD